ncbi:MAG: S8 family serine peptidase [Anaerolineae bacterium]|nr:S8 family serine peptidase [Anaerolineae bacterium]
MSDNPIAEETPEPIQPVEDPGHTAPPPPAEGEAPPEPPRWYERMASRRGILLIGAIVVVLLALAAIGGYFALNNQPTPTPPTFNFTPPPSLEELAAEYPEYADILLDPALDSVYKDFLLEYERGGTDAAIELAKMRGILNREGQVVVTLVLDTEDTAPLIEELEGMGIIVTTVAGNQVDIAIPSELIEEEIDKDKPGETFKDLITLEHVVRVKLPTTGLPDQEGIGGESLPVINAIAWHNAGVTGAGVKVGILDMGFDGYRDLLGSDLPASVTAQSFISGVEIDDTGIVHGAAVAEIIHDIAPDAELYLAAYQTDTERETAVQWLLSNNVDLIQHSCNSIYGPMDGTSRISRMIDDIYDSGILWINSAGNQAERHYRGTFTDSDNDGFHEFSPGNEGYPIYPFGWTRISLLWDDWASGSEDYALVIFDNDGNVVTASDNTQDGGDDAAEFIAYEFPDNGPYQLAVYANNITHPATFDIFGFYVDFDYPVAAYSVTIPADSRGALTVGAVYWENDALEDYSSEGPTWDGRLKPEISAPSVVESASYAPFDQRFNGTSAAAPHVSGSAALVMEAFPDMTAAEVRQFLLDRSQDLGNAGPDPAFGMGRLFLGSPPGVGDAPTPVVSPPDVPTVTPMVVTPLAPVLTPIPPAGGDGGGGISLSAILIVVACLVMLAVGFLVLLVIVILLARRRKPKRPTSPPRPPYPPPPAPPAPQQMRRPTPPPPPPPVQRIQVPPTPNPVPPPVLQPPPAPPQPKPAFCRYCGKPVKPGARFCNNCGKQLG